MNATEVHDRLDEIFLLDVREDLEWRAGHVAAAVHIPMGQLNDRLTELPTDTTIVCVCRSGGRSGAVTDALNRAGWTAENLEGGMHAWDHADLPFTTADGSPGTVA